MHTADIFFLHSIIGFSQVSDFFLLWFFQHPAKSDLFWESHKSLEQMGYIAVIYCCIRVQRNIYGLVDSESFFHAPLKEACLEMESLVIVYGSGALMSTVILCKDLEAN